MYQITNANPNEEATYTEEELRNSIEAPKTVWLYHTEQSWLITPLESDCLVTAEELDYYTALRALTPARMYFHCHSISDDVIRKLAFASATGTRIALIVESLGIHELLIEPYANTPHSLYGKMPAMQRTGLYEYIREFFQPHELDILLQRREAMRNNNDGRRSIGFEVTPEVQAFIRAYAPAYSIPLPKLETQEHTSNSFLPREWLTNMEKFKMNCSDPQQSLLKWEASEENARYRDPLHKIESVYQTLKFYVDHKEPYDNGYKDCPVCGLPYSTTAFDTETVFCRYCGTEHSAETTPVVSFADWMTTAK